MGQHIVIETVFLKNIGLHVLVVGQPVVRQFLGAQNKHGFVSQLIIFDDGKRRKRFAEAHAVGQNAAVVGFKLVDDAHGRVALIVEELLPHKRILIARSVVGKHVVADVVQKFPEYIVKNEKVEAFRRIFHIDGGNVFTDLFGDILHLVGVIPYGVEELKILQGDCRVVKSVDKIGYGIALLIAEIDGGKTLKRYIDGSGISVPDTGHGLHGGQCFIGAKNSLAPEPVGALPGYGTLRELVAELYFKFRTVKAVFTACLGDEELPALLFDFIGYFIGNEGGRRKDKFQPFYFFQLLFQSFVGIYGKAGSRNFQPAFRAKHCL